MAFFARCISGSSLKGMVRGEGDDDDIGGSGSTTPNDTAHGGSKFSNYSWAKRRLSAKSRSSLNSPKKQSSPPLSATSVDGAGLPRAAMEPVMERTRSALTDLEAVKFLIEDWSHKHWRPATPQDQERLDRLEQSDIEPLVALGEGAYGSVNLCRIQASRSAAGSQSGGRSTPPVSASRAHSLNVVVAVGGGGGGLAEQLAPTAAAAGALHRRCASGPVSPRRQPSGANGGGATDRDAGGAEAPPAEADGEPAAAAEPPPAEAPSGGTGDGGGGDMTYSTDAPASSSSPPAEEEDGEGCAMQSASSVNDPQLIVAVKRVPLGWNQERELMQLHRCQQCPFIVRLFGFVDDGSEHCSYVMEWAEGGDLGVMLSSLKHRRGVDKQRLLMSEASARYYMGCLLLALEFLHGHGLLHRDIKPSNLLLTSDGTAKLADLGFTVALDANGRTVGCCGTAGYIAPEVYAYGMSKSRLSYGVPADIWSAGATLYQILTGQVVADNPEEVLKKGWRPPTHPRFSHHLQDLFNRVLAVKPTARPQSATLIMRHPWFASFDWQALREGRMKAPYIPSERRRVTARTGPGGGGAAEPPPPPPPPAAAKPPSAPAAGADGATSSSSGSSGGSGVLRGQKGAPRLATVMEAASTQSPGGSCAVMDGDGKVLQRSALLGGGEGRVRREEVREDIRDGASFETETLETVTTAEARAAADGAAAAAAASAAAAAAVTATAPTAPPQGGAAAASGSSSSTSLEPILVDGDHGHRHGHGVAVRFALGVAECA